MPGGTGHVRRGDGRRERGVEAGDARQTDRRRSVVSTGRSAEALSDSASAPRTLGQRQPIGCGDRNGARGRRGIPLTDTHAAAQNRSRNTTVAVRRRRRVALVAATLIALAATAVVTVGGDGPTAQPARPEIERIAVGRGALGADIIRRRGAPAQRAVIFLHGWRLLGRTAYREWQLHLARRGLTVIAPRYQERRGTPPEDTLGNALAGVRAALARVPIQRGGLLVVGHSAGAALAADYAAVAAREDLPPAWGVLSIYPGRVIRASSRPIPQVDPSAIPSTVRLVVMASPADEIVGEQPARELYEAATGIPAARRRLVEVRDPEASGHFAPALASRAARRIFWAELDRLLGRGS